MLARRSATRSNRQTFLNRAGHIQRRCHIASRSTVGNRCRATGFCTIRFHTHTRHGSLKKQTAMEALVRSMVKFPVLALVNMHRPTKGASHDLVHQLCLALRQASKAHPQASACTRCSEKCTCDTFGAGLRRFLPGPTSLALQP